MGAFGRFLELSVPTADILRSLGFYRALGFTELSTGDIRPWHYAVVTDGSIILGLHGGGIEEPALTFVRPNLARQVRALEQYGQEFEFQRLGAEEFNEAALRTPDGQLILMIEARTFSPADEDSVATPAVGRCAEVSLACVDVDVSRVFFENAGFLAAQDDGRAAPDTAAGRGVVRLNAPGITLGLRESARIAALTLRFPARDRKAMIRALEEKDLRPAREPEGQVLKAPEGTRLVIV